MSGGAAIVVTGVRKSFEDGRVPALRDISFAVEPGELVALTGASGSGKSTLLNLIGALDTPDTGTILVDGLRVDELASPARYRGETVGFVFQAHNLLPTLTAAENVQVPMFGRRPRREREVKAGDLLREVGLEHRADARPAVLSGGERQRVAIARALANDPRLLLADEPTILLVTNDEDVAAHAARRLRLRDGVIHAEAPQPARG